jgi:hypothetical protein
MYGCSFHGDSPFEHFRFDVIGFKIEKAEEMGYFVSGTRDSSRHDYNYVKCAGSLPICLSYIEAAFEDQARDEDKLKRLEKLVKTPATK